MYRDLRDKATILTSMKTCKIHSKIEEANKHFLNHELARVVTTLYFPNDGQEVLRDHFNTNKPFDLFIIVSGGIRLVELHGSPSHAIVLSSGDFFGSTQWMKITSSKKQEKEYALKDLNFIVNAPETLLIKVPGDQINNICIIAKELEDIENLKYLSKLHPLNLLFFHNLGIGLIKEIEYKRGDIVFFEGRLHPYFYVVKAGEISIIKKRLSEIIEDPLTISMKINGIQSDLYKSRGVKREGISLITLCSGNILNLEESILNYLPDFHAAVTSHSCKLLQVNAFTLRKRMKKKSIPYKTVLNKGFEDRRKLMKNLTDTRIKKVYFTPGRMDESKHITEHFINEIASATSSPKSKREQIPPNSEYSPINKQAPGHSILRNLRRSPMKMKECVKREKEILSFITSNSTSPKPKRSESYDPNYLRLLKKSSKLSQHIFTVLGRSKYSDPNNHIKMASRITLRIQRSRNRMDTLGLNNVKI